MKLLTMLALMFLFEAQASELSLAKGHVTFLARANPGFMKIEGKATQNPKGVLHHSPEGFSGIVTLSLDSLETGIDLRDEHMKEKYLEVKKFPEAKLELKSARNGKFIGALSLHGNTKEIEGTYSYEDQELIAAFEIKVSDYKIDVPSWMGVTVADKVEIKIQSKLK